MDCQRVLTTSPRTLRAAPRNIFTMNQNAIRIFRELPSSHSAEVNPYYEILKKSCKNKTLPLLYGPFLKEKKGNWREEFENLPKDLILEIGCHKGLTLSQVAEDNKEIGFIGIDITYKRVCETASLAVSKELQNIRSVLANGNELSYIFQESELSGIIIFFPDPWLKKKKQKKNRLIKPEFCDIIRNLLKKEGFVWFKTDSEEYFTEARDAFLNSGFKQGDLNNTFFKKNYESTFESRFRKQGLAKYESIFISSKDTMFASLLA